MGLDWWFVVGRDRWLLCARTPEVAGVVGISLHTLSGLRLGKAVCSKKIAAYRFYIDLFNDITNNLTSLKKANLLKSRDAKLPV